jgi:hypothetical protein
MSQLGHLRRCNPASKSIKGRCCPKADKLVRRGERSNVPIATIMKLEHIKKDRLAAVSPKSDQGHEWR